ncbi:MAG: 16S rRNA (uracil(1498)-N(3))-methyltransferase [Paludibacteraceae bacterium]|nr:16S rRNA (uracil(1498)-N(3))-methyltransferase [Paludibacteraceae bacterium]
MYLFYAPDILNTPVLPEEESQHCVQVLRTQRGEAVFVTDGVGNLYHCVVTNPHRKHCELKVLRVESPDALHAGYVHIAIAPTKNIDRLEWMIEKCTEMGVDEISLLLCEHSERKTVNHERLEKIMISAAKQSLKTTFPKLNDLVKCNDFIAAERPDTDLFIAHCMSSEDLGEQHVTESITQTDIKLTEQIAENMSGSNNTLQMNYEETQNKLSLQHHIVPGHRVLILIGPEGDFSPAEVQTALAHDYQPVSLGRARLRTETAGLVACHTAILLNSF